MTQHTVSINRAPVLTLWAGIVAERLGYDRASALTLGKAVAGLNAQSRGQRLGILHQPSGKATARVHPGKAKGGRPAGAVELLGRGIAVSRTKDGVRALAGGKAIDPAAVERYLEQKFGDALAPARSALGALARAYPPRALAGVAYGLYEQFRPQIPEGQKGWGAKGELDLDHVRAMARKDGGRASGT